MKKGVVIPCADRLYVRYIFVQSPSSLRRSRFEPHSGQTKDYAIGICCASLPSTHN